MVCAVAVATIYVAQPILAQLGSDLGIPEAELGWIVAAGQLGYLAGLVLLVPLGDMLDRRTLIVGQLLLAAVGTGLASTATGSLSLLAGLVVTGLFAVVVQTTVAFAADLADADDRGRTIGLLTAGVIVGILGARVLAGLLTGLWGWRSSYLVLGTLLVVLAVVVRRVLPADRRSGPARYGPLVTSLGKLFREPLFVSRGLIAFFMFASFGTLWSGLALPLADEPWHLDAAQIGMFGVAGLAGALGAARAGAWADAGRADLITGGALVLLGASWVATGQASWSLVLVVVGVVLLDFAVQAAHVSNQHLLTTVYEQHTSSVVGGYMVFYSFGSALGATATTAAYAAAGWPGSAVLGGAFASGGVLVWVVSRRTVARSQACRNAVAACESTDSVSAARMVDSRRQCCQ